MVMATSVDYVNYLISISPKDVFTIKSNACADIDIPWANEITDRRIEPRTPILRCRRPNRSATIPCHLALKNAKQSKKNAHCQRLLSSSPQVEVAVSTLCEFFKPLPFEKDPKN